MLAMDELYEKRGQRIRSDASEAARLLKSDTGTRLAEIIERETGEHFPCHVCREEVERLNRLTRNEVLSEQDQIAAGILQRGRDSLGWWNPRRWAIKLLPDQVRERVIAWIQEAVEGATDTDHVSSVNSEVHLSARVLSDHDIAVARGVAPDIPRAEVLEARKHWKLEGFDLPPLEQRSVSPSIRSMRSTQFPRQQKTSRSVGRNWASAFTRTCVYLGSEQKSGGCSCSGNRRTGIFTCRHPQGPGMCCLDDGAKARLSDRTFQQQIVSCESCKLRVDLPRFITTQQYMTDISTLASLVPPDVKLIAGVSRSGLCAATMLSMLLHLPLDIIRQQQGDITAAGNGWRLQRSTVQGSGTVLVVDDTCMTGNSMRSISPVVESHYGTKQVMYATVYCNPLATQKPDLWAVDLPWPHLLEWNLFNSVLIPACSMDFDGILCHDCPPADDDDGPRYRSFLETVRPLYPVRRQAIPLVVTARLEKYRDITEAWLERWGIKVNQLVMGPWSNNRERAIGDVAAFKSRHFAEFMKTRVRPGPHLFIESDVRQAARIAQLSGGVVVCPAAGKCFS